jgi:chemotaxis protein CheX
MASLMLMSDFSSIDAEVLDAVGEITNMVIGAFKQQLEEVVGMMTISIPTVIYGHNFTAKHLGDEEWVMVPFTCEKASFEVQVCLSRKRLQPHATTRVSIPMGK